ncbi:hypothetical protein [Rheinheimera aquimaris]|jgi:hypothetical protein|uniref:hypothetical protein n=1 Tax=Rheinheimera aquimaris TaxID=412437 RepID=UPI001E63C92C|nr:hypothetical protein [Rheinheimera aquimaris]MCD1600026.1 hypothetical protein [Rheinheimera aquimaris]
MSSMQPLDKQETENWLTSKEAKKMLKVSSCELMHLRVSGKLIYKKQGNAFLYQMPVKSEQSA